ncbi:uncharacterized protein LOC117007654 [Catharus ustulatus]|uniref:uncharacterized protein LOC117007654 n=1 Tax=Catharus ustulatus TaxID=91951 RepID=UPI00140CF930|nr:uncharacterized protein LOC117007654 [Catharus ustulatus]XP_032936854.1 uncharacterized protein LOC117007654 [Catharus ustulatus]
MSPIKNIYMHFFSLPDSLKAPTFIVLQIFVLFSYWDWKSAPNKSEVGITSIFWKGRFFKNFIFGMFINGFFFLSFFKIILFLIYTRRFDVYLQEEQWVMVCPGDVVVREKRGILKSFSIKRQWIPVFWESGLIVSWAGLTLARGDPQGGELLQEKSLVPWRPWEKRWNVGCEKIGVVLPKNQNNGKNKHRNEKFGHCRLRLLCRDGGAASTSLGVLRSSGASDLSRDPIPDLLQPWQRQEDPEPNPDSSRPMKPGLGSGSLGLGSGSLGLGSRSPGLGSGSLGLGSGSPGLGSLGLVSLGLGSGSLGLGSGSPGLGSPGLGSGSLGLGSQGLVSPGLGSGSLGLGSGSLGLVSLGRGSGSPGLGSPGLGSGGCEGQGGEGGAAGI